MALYRKTILIFSYWKTSLGSYVIVVGCNAILFWFVKLFSSDFTNFATAMRMVCFNFLFKVRRFWKGYKDWKQSPRLIWRWKIVSNFVASLENLTLKKPICFVFVFPFSRERNYWFWYKQYALIRSCNREHSTCSHLFLSYHLI